MSLFVGFHGKNRTEVNAPKEIEEFSEIHFPVANGEMVIPGSIVVVEVNFGEKFAQEIEPLR